MYGGRGIRREGEIYGNAANHEMSGSVRDGVVAEAGEASALREE